MFYINLFVNLIFSYFIIKEDIKSRKILNKFLIKYIIFLIIFKIIDFYFFSLKFDFYLIQYYIISIILPFILYLFKIWGAGDSKLLTLYFLSVPNNIIKKFYYIYILKYLNILFVISCLIYFSLGLSRIIKLKKLDFNKEKIKIQLLFLLFTILFLNIVNIIIFRKFDINVYIAVLLNLGIIFIIQKLLTKLLLNKKIYFFLLVLILLNLNFISLRFIYRIMFAVGIFFLREIIIFSEKKEILIEELKIGDILSKQTLDKFLKSRIKNLPKIDLGSNKKVYILQNIEELEAIKCWKNSKYGTDKIEIEKSIPFSIYICLSYFITFIYCIYIIKRC